MLSLYQFLPGILLIPRLVTCSTGFDKELYPFRLMQLDFLDDAFQSSLTQQSGISSFRYLQKFIYYSSKGGIIILERNSFLSRKGHRSSRGLEIIEPSGFCMDIMLGARGSSGGT